MPTPTNHGAVEWLKIPDPNNRGGFIKKWIRDSWARKEIVSLKTSKQDALDAAQLAAVNSGITAAQLTSILSRLHDLDGQ